MDSVGPIAQIRKFDEIIILRQPLSRIFVVGVRRRVIITVILPETKEKN